MFLSIRKASKNLKIPEHLLRSLVAQGRCPGLYSGNRFLVNVSALVEQLETESRRPREVKA